MTTFADTLRLNDLLPKYQVVEAAEAYDVYDTTFPDKWVSVGYVPKPHAGGPDNAREKVYTDAAKMNARWLDGRE